MKTAAFGLAALLCCTVALAITIPGTVTDADVAAASASSGSSSSSGAPSTSTISTPGNVTQATNSSDSSSSSSSSDSSGNGSSSFGDLGGSLSGLDSTNSGATVAIRAGGTPVPLTQFSPVWDQTTPLGPNALLVDIVTDTVPANVATNQIPLTQSLGALLNVDPNTIYFYNVTNNDGLYTVVLLVDLASPDAKTAAVTSLANTDSTAAFYANAQAYSINILNGPEVASNQLQLSSDVISIPDVQTNYNGDTGVKTNNFTGSPQAAAAFMGNAAPGVRAVLVACALGLAAAAAVV